VQDLTVYSPRDPARFGLACGAASPTVRSPGASAGRRRGTRNNRLRITDAPPILLMDARHDPVSAYSWEDLPSSLTHRC